MNKGLIETYIDEERKINYTCEATFGFLRKLDERGFQLGPLYYELQKGNCKITTLRSILQCALIKVNKEEVDFNTSEKHAEQIIERFGILEVNSVAYDLMTRIMIGDIKKTQATQVTFQERMKKVLEAMNPNTTSKNSWKVGLLWVAILIIFGLVVGMSTQLF